MCVTEQADLINWPLCVCSHLQSLLCYITPKNQCIFFTYIFNANVVSIDLS